MENEDTDRVRRVGSKEVNRRIDEEIEANIRSFAHKDDRAISARIQELEKEWDVERAIETNASSLALTGLALGVFVNRRWLLLPGVVMAFLLQHALQGWCPPVPVLRRLGFRTRQEIDKEKYALKILRGDYRDLFPASEGQKATAIETTFETTLPQVRDQRDPGLPPSGFEYSLPKVGLQQTAGTKGISMAKLSGTKPTTHSLNEEAPDRAGRKGAKVPNTITNAPSGGKGDKDGKGDIQAKKAGTSIHKKSASK